MLEFMFRPNFGYPEKIQKFDCSLTFVILVENITNNSFEVSRVFHNSSDVLITSITHFNLHTIRTLTMVHSLWNADRNNLIKRLNLVEWKFRVHFVAQKYW